MSPPVPERPRYLYPNRAETVIPCFQIAIENPMARDTSSCITDLSMRKLLGPLGLLE
jgi:hypothetical protein